MTKRMDVDFLGRHLGTASGWDGDPGEWMCFNNFEPAAGIKIAACACLNIFEIEGLITSTNAEGVTLLELDAVTVLAAIQRKEPIA